MPVSCQKNVSDQTVERTVQEFPPRFRFGKRGKPDLRDFTCVEIEVITAREPSVRKYGLGERLVGSLTYKCRLQRAHIEECLDRSCSIKRCIPAGSAHYDGLWRGLPYLPGLRRDDWPLPDPKDLGITQSGRLGKGKPGHERGVRVIR